MPTGEARTIVCLLSGPRAEPAIELGPVYGAGVRSALTAADGQRDQRVAIHVGTVDEAQLVGPDVDRAIALCRAAPAGTVLLSASAAALASPDTPVVDLGHHRLADLGEPEHVWAIGDQPHDIRTLSTAPNNLPAELTSFVGRRDDIAALADLVTRDRLVTVTGPGGAGKSRLALHVAAALVGDMRDGVWLVELAGVSLDASAEEVAQAFRAIGSATSTPIADETDLAGRIGDRQLLVVLDQCEHVRDACRDLLGRLLRSCPGLRVLATSREPLGAPGEERWPTPSLAPDDARTLFRARARDTTWGTADDAATATVCELVGGLPLALELAAGWTGVLSPAEIIGRLTDRLGFLDASPAAEQTRIGAALDWSYEQLQAAEQVLLTRLVVFADGFTPAAVEHVCADDSLPAPDVLPALAALAERALVTPHASLAGDRRFRLNDVVRQYAMQQLDGTTPQAVAPDRRTFSLVDEGDYWAIGAADATARLKASKGIEYLHALLSQPGREIHVIDLVGAGATGVDTDGGEVIDAQARASYRRRLLELEEERDEARNNNDLVRLERLDDEWDALTAELSSALGLGGRTRRAPAASERARSSVTKAIRGAIDKIGHHDQRLAAHLHTSIRTGAFCSYQPDPDWPGTWILGSGVRDVTT